MWGQGDMATIRSGAYGRYKPRGKSTPGMAAVKEGPPSSTSNTIIRFNAWSRVGDTNISGINDEILVKASLAWTRLRHKK